MKLPDELGYYEHGITIELQINEFVIYLFLLLIWRINIKHTIKLKANVFIINTVFIDYDCVDSFYFSGIF